MKLFSYKISRDYGFAPNPFHGTCSLATCKPRIRRAAKIGDLIVGCGGKESGVHGKVIYIARVSEKTNFQSYSVDPRFIVKKPKFDSSKAHAFGDNIYSRMADGSWKQARSHHSHEDGSTNFLNLNRDTGRTDAVLLSNEFSYFGREAIPIPDDLRDLDGDSLYPNARDFRSSFSEKFIKETYGWFLGLPRGNLGRPTSW